VTIGTNLLGCVLKLNPEFFALGADLVFRGVAIHKSGINTKAFECGEEATSLGQAVQPLFMYE